MSFLHWLIPTGQAAVVAPAIGFGTGILAGMFGVGGGLIMTPLIALLMPLCGIPVTSLQAVETPMLAILPTTLSGAWMHMRAKNVEVYFALVSGCAGAFTAYVGARLAPIMGGSSLLLLTGAVLVFVAIDMFRRAATVEEMPDEAAATNTADPVAAAPVAPAASTAPAVPKSHRPTTAILIGAGLLAGLGAGLLGIGGGFILVPLYIGALGLSIKRAAGTSLLAISIISVPGLITHIVVTHAINIPIGILLAVGSVPGALLGAKIGLGAREKILHIGFGMLMIVAAILLVVQQLKLI